MKKALLLAIGCTLLGCTQSPSLDLLVPSEARIGDIIDLRDSALLTFGTEGSVTFGSVEATGIRSWTPSDIYVEVPPGISGTVMVKVQVGKQKSIGREFHVVGEDAFPRTMSFGDSVTYWGSGWLGGEVEGNPYLAQFNPLHLNHGRRGEKVTEEGTLPRWRNVLEFGDCDFAVLMHGINDLSDPLIPEEAISLEEMEEATIGLIDEISSTDTQLILCTLPPRVDSCGDFTSPTTEEFNDWLRTYAGEHGIPLVDVYEDFVSTPGWEAPYFGANCLHPIAEGYTRIAEMVTDKIVELYLPTCTDLDADGYGAPAAPSCPHAEPDCDDSNPDIHPGIIEGSYGDPLCSDGLDNDCDGFTDELDGGCQECSLPEDCDDGDVCTDDDCVDYACVHSYNTAPCDDGDACTMDDVCSNGACGGSPLDADGDTYVSDACEGTDCDDSNPDVHPGIIEGSYGDPMCSDDLDNDCDGDVDLEDSGCQECVDSGECDDGLWCNGEEQCVGHVCQEGLPPDCADGVVCTEDLCNEENDACENPANDALCDDGDPCTDDVCDSLTGCLNACNAAGPEDACCEEPACAGSPQCEP